MLKILRFISSVIVIILSIFILATQNFTSMPYMMLFLGFNQVVLGIIALQKDKKTFAGYMCIAAALFIFLVSIQGFYLK